MLKQKIKAKLLQRELSIRKMCQTLEIRQASVSEFLSGKRKNISIDKLEKILIYLEII
jgi:predicted XRE-type DNA-binding protein